MSGLDPIASVISTLCSVADLMIVYVRRNAMHYTGSIIEHVGPVTVNATAIN
jgi:hypothetical protein